MQVYSVTQRLVLRTRPHNALMHPGGRPAKNEGSIIGERIAAARRRADISQRELAQRLGVTQQTIGTLERRTSKPTGATLVKIAEALNVSVNELLGVKEDERSNGMGRGRAHDTFKAVAQLPRRQQTKILDVVEALLAKQDAA
jgi:transcriptional regulator with XRE-family HTH domain